MKRLIIHCRNASRTFVHILSCCSHKRNSFRHLDTGMGISSYCLPFIVIINSLLSRCLKKKQLNTHTMMTPTLCFTMWTGRRAQLYSQHASQRAIKILFGFQQTKAPSSNVSYLSTMAFFQRQLIQCMTKHCLLDWILLRLHFWASEQREVNANESHSFRSAIL